MRKITSIDHMRQIIDNHRKLKLLINNMEEKIVLVPTMGNLHPGHLALISSMKQKVRKVVVSIFVNPLQFGRNEDFATYPRTLEKDIELLENLDVDWIFIPDEKEMYPNYKQQEIYAGTPSLVQIKLPNLSDELCGKSRPGFFYGVASVVLSLCNIVRPDILILGEKDYQQLTIIRTIFANLHYPISVQSVETVREPDGLAYSSRNQYLSEKERLVAFRLYRTLNEIKQLIVENKEEILNSNSEHLNFSPYEEEGIAKLTELGFKVDYFSIRNREDLQIPTKKNKDLIILSAAYLGKTRLIDNIFLSID